MKPTKQRLYLASIHVFLEVLIYSLESTQGVRTDEGSQTVHLPYSGPLFGTLSKYNREDLVVLSASQLTSVTVNSHSTILKKVDVFDRSTKALLSSYYNWWTDIFVVETMKKKVFKLRNTNVIRSSQKNVFDQLELQLHSGTSEWYRLRIQEAVRSPNPVQNLDIVGYSVYPGTRSCYVGQPLPAFVVEAVPSPYLDTCCKKRAECNKHRISKNKLQYDRSVHSADFLYRVHCDCDEEFRTCLSEDKKSPEDALAIGQLFFNVFQLKCYQTATTCSNLQVTNMTACPERQQVTNFHWRSETEPFSLNSEDAQ